jgi:hypothetical protein
MVASVRSSAYPVLAAAGSSTHHCGFVVAPLVVEWSGGRDLSAVFSWVSILLGTNQSILVLLSWINSLSLCKSWIGTPSQI